MKRNTEYYKEIFSFVCVNKCQNQTHTVAGGRKLEADELSGTITVSTNKEDVFYSVTPFYEDDKELVIVLCDYEDDSFIKIESVDMLLTYDLEADFETYKRIVDKAITNDQNKLNNQLTTPAR